MFLMTRHLVVSFSCFSVYCKAGVLGENHLVVSFSCFWVACTGAQGEVAPLVVSFSCFWLRGFSVFYISFLV